MLSMLKLNTFIFLILVKSSLTFKLSGRQINESKYENETDLFESHNNGVSITIVSPFNLNDFKSVLQDDISINSSVGLNDDASFNIRPILKESHIMRIESVRNKGDTNLKRYTRNSEYSDENKNVRHPVTLDETTTMSADYDAYFKYTANDDNDRSYEQFSRNNESSLIIKNDTTVFIDKANDTEYLSNKNIDTERSISHIDSDLILKLNENNRNETIHSLRGEHSNKTEDKSNSNKPNQNFNIDYYSVESITDTIDISTSTNEYSITTLLSNETYLDYDNNNTNDFNTTEVESISNLNETDIIDNVSDAKPVLIDQSILNPDTWYWRQSFILSCIITSVPFLSATLLVFWILPQLNRSDHGKSIMCYLLSVMISYTVLAVTIAYGKSLGPMCVPLGYLLHYCIVAISSWLNIMCLDIIWAFSVLEQRREAPSRFKLYSYYAWSLPLIIVAVTFGLSYSPLPEKYLPVVGGDLCFLESELTQWIYCHGPVLVLTTANVIMFIATAVVILIHTKKTSILSSPSSARSRAQRRWFRLYSKLFIVMGMNWIVELLSLAFDYNNVSIISLITDTTNGLLGVIIFGIYVCRLRIYKQLKKWWNGEDMIAGKRRSALRSTLTRFRENLLRSKFGSSIFGLKGSDKEG